MPSEQFDLPAILVKALFHKMLEIPADQTDCSLRQPPGPLRSPLPRISSSEHVLHVRYVSSRNINVFLRDTHLQALVLIELVDLVEHLVEGTYDAWLGTCEAVAIIFQPEYLAIYEDFDGTGDLLTLQGRQMWFVEQEERVASWHLLAFTCVALPVTEVTSLQAALSVLSSEFTSHRGLSELGAL